MSVDFSVFDDLTTLRILYHMRKNVQKYSQGDKSPENNKLILEAFAVLSVKDDETKEKIDNIILSAIKSRIAKVPFSPLAYKKQETKEDKKAKTQNKNNKKHNAAMDKIKKQIYEEIKIAKNQEKYKDLPNDPELVSISISDDERKFLLQIAERDTPVELKLIKYKTKIFSGAGMADFNKGGQPKNGINNSTYKAIIEAGKEGLIFETKEVSEKNNKKYTEAKYKTFLGMPKGNSLSETHKKELEILNSLSSVEEQNAFISGLLEYVNKSKNNKALIEKIEKTEDKLALITDIKTFEKLLADYKADDFGAIVQENFINNIVLKDKANIWQHFTQKGAENSEYYSDYEKKLINVISRNNELFENAVKFKSNDEMKQNIKTTFEKIKSLKSPALTDEVCAEIFTLGIFKEGISKNTDDNKIKNMNLILNEFGLNIALHPLSVTKVPDASIKTAAEQLKSDRNNFAESKKEYSREIREFDDHLKKLGINEPAEKDVHHYFALRYNAFVDQNLNAPSNYVQTAKQNEWNISGRDFTHRFAVSGEFLIKNGNDDFAMMGFNALRKNFESDKNMQIMALTLQTKDDNGKFSDLLKPANIPGKFGTYISSDKGSGNLISVPEYCKSQANNRNIILEVLSETKKHKK